MQVVELTQLKKCCDCKIEHPLDCFTTRKKPRNKAGRTEYYSICKYCARQRAKAWMIRNPQRYAQKEAIRGTYKGRKVPLCGVCREPCTKWDRRRIDNISAFYHAKCAEEKTKILAQYNENKITPERRAYLQELSIS